MVKKSHFNFQPNFPLGEAVDKMDMRTLMMTVVVVSVTILSIKVSTKVVISIWIKPTISDKTLFQRSTLYRRFCPSVEPNVMDLLLGHFN